MTLELPVLALAAAPTAGAVVSMDNAREGGRVERGPNWCAALRDYYYFF